nr:hypothetical protein [Euryarchaeota archaeon]
MRGRKSSLSCSSSSLVKLTLFPLDSKMVRFCPFNGPENPAILAPAGHHALDSLDMFVGHPIE